MISRKLILKNPQGLHMRPAMLFSNEMGKFPCRVAIRSKGNETDGKSIMNLIAAGISCGEEIEIICDGEQEQEAMQAAVNLIESGLGDSKTP